LTSFASIYPCDDRIPVAGRTVSLRGTGTGPDICHKTERVNLGLWSETGRLPLPHLWPQSSSARTWAGHSDRNEYVAIVPEYHGPAQYAYGPDLIASGIGNGATHRRRAATTQRGPRVARCESLDTYSRDNQAIRYRIF
jgi:hypothetical protein